MIARITYFRYTSLSAIRSGICTGFFFIFLQISLYNAFTPSPRLPNAQANPQKNLPKTAVYIHTTISTVTNDVSATFSPAPICVNIYFTPANAAVYTDGIKIKYSNWMIALIHICIFFNCFAFIYFTAFSNACFVAFLISCIKIPYIRNFIKFLLCHTIQ